MESADQPAIKAAEEHVVSGGLMQELHDANEHFHQCKRVLEQTMSSTEYEHQEKVDQAHEQLRAAERRVEEINQKIHDSLKPPPAV